MGYLDYKWNSDLKIQSNLCIKFFVSIGDAIILQASQSKLFLLYKIFQEQVHSHNQPLFHEENISPSTINVFSLCNIKRDISGKHFLRIIIIHSRNNTSYYSTLKYYKILPTS